jgi:hypothetical protein
MIPLFFGSQRRRNSRLPAEKQLPPLIISASLLSPSGCTPILLDKVAQDFDKPAFSTLETVDFAGEIEFSP